MPVTVRSATPDDHDFVVETARRFAAFGPPPWRTAMEVVEGEVRCLDDYFDGRMPGCDLFIAEQGRERLGFAFVEPHVDYFTQDTFAHLGMIAVTEAAEGSGAAAALLATAEQWGRARGYPALTLNVFEDNARARAFYEKSGFRVETVRYTKALG
ncbi:MAG TPA: GNAT family N-acetyltransferase [Vicinamibacterales bacterium]|jgi:ribosomal protein S18 acetylase RimI-like enzyme|nr:GNAT family N-acetyltransferase [Vicinamibacterales bacterium]